MTLKTTVSPDDVIKLLNEILTLDREAMSALIEQRVPSNEKLSNHSTVQVTEDAEGTFRVGLLGILNGIFGVDSQGCGVIAAVFEEDTVIRFERYRHPDEEPYPDIIDRLMVSPRRRKIELSLREGPGWWVGFGGYVSPLTMGPETGNLLEEYLNSNLAWYPKGLKEEALITLDGSWT